jgi:uncharacterized membrane protein YeaQ/YmgE (transglycosylase-associated protein family)
MAVKLLAFRCEALCVQSNVQKGVREMHILYTLIVGLIVGVVAKLLMPGRDPGGMIITILIGIAGSFVGTAIGRMLGMYAEGSSAGFIMSVIGAVLLLLLYRTFSRRQPV